MNTNIINDNYFSNTSNKLNTLSNKVNTNNSLSN